MPNSSRTCSRPTATRVQRRRLSRHCQDSEGAHAHRDAGGGPVAGLPMIRSPKSVGCWILRTRWPRSCRRPRRDRSKDVSGWTKAKNRVRLWGQQLADWISGDGGPAAPAKSAVEWPAPPTMQWMARGKDSPRPCPAARSTASRSWRADHLVGHGPQRRGSVVRERPIQISARSGLRQSWGSPWPAAMPIPGRAKRSTGCATWCAPSPIPRCSGAG